MELENYDFSIPPAMDSGGITELVCDYPVSCEPRETVVASEFPKSTLALKPPPQPPPPAPPPISQLPTRDQRLLSLDPTASSSSAPPTPSRGKVVLSKKERKELGKLNKLLHISNSPSSCAKNNNGVNNGSLSASSSPYKGRVTELKNCIAKINSRGIFASLNRGSLKCLNTTHEASFVSLPQLASEISPPAPAPDSYDAASGPDFSTEDLPSNNNDAVYAEKLKNLPVRQKKVHTSHLENYCLFDPIDFINEKDYRKSVIPVGFEASLHIHGLRDPLFSSSKNLNFEEEELVPEIIYAEQAGMEKPDCELKVPADEASGLDQCAANNFEHHNYFVIDPEDFEDETANGFSNAQSNSNFVKSKLEEELSSSMDKLIDVCEQNSSLTNSQESKTNTSNTSTSTTTTSTSVALLESSSSASSSSSSTNSSEASLQTTLHRTKKKLTFLRLSPFRNQPSKAPEANENPEKYKNTSEIEIMNSNHIMHLQQMLLAKQDTIRSRTVPIESNYALFNPGPVPSRNIQYKIRKPRPLSTHSFSDADSGFLSPCSPDEFATLKFNSTILVLQQCDSVQGYIEIYTDWANYYLERAKSKKKVTDLSIDCRDGLLLADVIEAVTSFKVPDLIKKPKTQQQMYDNVNSCLNVLRSQNVCLESITTSDICAGRLKAVLALFFALSRHKTLKQQQQQRKSDNGNETAMSNRQTPGAYTKTNGGTSIPLPSTVMVQRRCNDKVRPLPPTPNNSQSIPSLAKSNDIHANFSNNPPMNNLAIQNNKIGNNNSLRPPNTKSQNQQSGIPSPTIAAAASPAPMAQKHSMLDKLKIFNKEKQTAASNMPGKVANKNPAQSKRTSSSSGFSSARSERSDSSISLNDGAMSQLKSSTSSVLNTCKARESKISTKQSKLLAAQLKKEQSKAVKSDKKEHSPARSINKEITSESIENKTCTTARSKNSFPRLNEKNTSKTSSKSSLNSKSESRSSLVLPAAKTLSSPTGSGLPKPIAAIKGTSKLPNTLSSARDDNRNQQMMYINSNHDLMRREKSDISMTECKNVSIDRRAATLSGLANSTEQHITNSIHPQLQEDVNKSSALYANAPNISGENISIQNCAQKYEVATHRQHELAYASNSNPLRSPRSSGLATPTRKLQSNPMANASLTNPIQSLANHPAPHALHTHTQPLPQRNAPVSTPNKFHTMSTRMSGVGTIFEEEKSVDVVPMRTLLQGYNSHVTLPARAKGRYNNNFGDYFENENVQTGYCSDGDSFRVRNSRLLHRPAPVDTGTSVKNHDIDFDGYLSEGSGGVGQRGCSKSGSSNSKNFLSMMRSRTQLPTTIEERMRSSRGSLDSIGSVPISSIASQTVTGDSNNKMQGTVRGSNNTNAYPSPQNHMHHPNLLTQSPQHSAENWQNGTGQLNGHTPENSNQSSPSASRRHGGSPKQGSTRTKVPTSFGYVKRANGSATAEQQNIVVSISGHSMVNDAGSKNFIQKGRTAHVSAVPRSNTNGRKFSGGTQTLPSEHMTRVPPATQHRSFSLTGPGASQLSKSIRERLAAGPHNLSKLGSETQMFQNRSTKSEKMYPTMLNRGSDVEIEPYYCLPVGAIGTQKMITAQMAAVGGAAVMQDGQSRKNNSSAAWSEPTSPTPLNRGFGGVLSPTHNAVAVTGFTQPGGRLTYPKKNDEVHGSAASLLSGGSSLYGSAEERQAHEIRRLKRELIDAREQVLSLSSQLSTNAHVVAAFEQSLSNMTSRLQHLTATAERKDDELTDMRQTIELLRKQSIQAGLTTAHMQSMGVQTPAQAELLNNNKLQQLSMSNAQSQAMRTKYQHHNGTSTASASASASPGSSSIQRHHSTDSVCSVNSASSACSGQDKKQKKKGWLRSSFTKAFSRNAKISKTSRHSGPSNHQSIHQQQSQQHHSHVRGSKHSLEKGVTNSNGHDSYTETSNLATQSPLPRQNSTSTALNGSPSKRSPAKTVTLIENAKPIDAIEHDGLYMVEELKKQLREKDLVLTDIRLEALSSASQLESLKETVNKMRAEMMSLKQNNERLQKLVTSHSLAGSETSLGNAMSPNGSIGDSRRYSLADGNCRPQMELPGRLQEDVEEENVPPAPAPEPPPMSPSHTHIDLAPPPPALESIPSPTHLANATEELPDITDGKKIAIACYLGQPESFPKYFEEMLEADDLYAKNASGNNGGIPTAEDSERPKSFCTPSPNEFVIAYTYISGKTTWQNLDYIVRKTFKDYLSTIDPGTNLGLNTDSITSYHLGEAKRGPEMGFPELLPCGYIIGNVRTLYICLQGVGSLAFDSLIPRSIVHRYISLMSEHRRLILCGPSGTGKSYLARRLAEFLVARSGRGNLSEAIATFNVDHKSSKELRQYLGHVAEQASIANGASELPSVIILDNLHHASALGDVFSSLLSSGPAAKLPCIIGTMSQATCNTTNLQLHHNFRWVLTANHMEPVKGFLGRFLRRRLFQLELQLQQPQSELAAVLAWLPLVWQHINRFLETHSSSDVTIGPRLFLSCPLDLKDSQVWFTDIWNYHLSPYLVEAVREGVQLYGRRGGVWNDPSAFIRNSYPWPFGLDSVPPLRQINAEDVGLEGMTANSNENTDPLLNMLMRLQEAANYPENQDEESECASLDSNITPDSSAGAE